jgi:dipeptidyl aminopeptidase/acylaminoacyl peptidase
MAEETHRFEARYLDGLIGPWPEAKTTYNERSPLLHAEQINCPVIFFQGSEDKVVPREQTERMATALRNKDLPVDMHIFEGEGHGFRDSVVLIEVLNSTEQFFNHFFELKPRDESSG